MDTQAPITTADGSISAVTAGVIAATREERLYPDDQPQAPAAQQSPPADQRQAKEPPGATPPADQPSTEASAASDYQLQMPEGVQLDQELLTAAVPMLREAGISSDQASKLVPFVSQVQERFHETQLEQFNGVIASWKEQAKTDPEIGGTNLKETSRLAGIALHAGGAAAANHEVRQLLNDSGLGDHPAFLRLFRTMGREIERLRRRSGFGGGEQSRERALYPDDEPKLT